MDIYEALGKLKENKKVDRVAQRKKLVEKKLNESHNERKVGKKPLKEGLYDGAENVDDLIYLYIRDQLIHRAVYVDDVADFLEYQDLDPDYIYQYDIDDDYIEDILEDAINKITDYYIKNSISPSANESLSESTHRYATKWGVFERGKKEPIKEFEGEGNGYKADKDAYNKASAYAKELMKKENNPKINGWAKYECKPLNTKTTKL